MSTPKLSVAEMKQNARAIFAAGVAAVYPPQMVRNALTVLQDGNCKRLNY